MAAHTQLTVKRQKLREGRADVEYFQGIEKVQYNKMASITDTTVYRYYNATEKILSRTMEEWLKYSVSLSEFRNWGSSNHTPNFQWDDQTNTVDNSKRLLKALFEFCTKLGVKYWTAFDSDLIPYSENSEERKGYWEDIVEFIQELSQKYNMRCLWIAPDLHRNYRYNSGAMTSPDANTYIQAATQIKKCLEIAQRLNAECFLIYPCREGYESIIQTDVAKELKLFAKLLKFTADYKEKLHLRCQLLIMPYFDIFFDNFGRKYQHSCWENDVVKQYMWDVTSCLYLLKNYMLERYYKICTPPDHHMYMANVYNMLGGVFVMNDHFDSKKLTLMMKCIIDHGAPLSCGINLQLSTHQWSPRGLMTSHIARGDSAARALRVAATLQEQQPFHNQKQQRYSSYNSGFGSRLLNTEVTLEECEDYYKKNQMQHTDVYSNSEDLDVVLQRYIDTCDHI